MSEINPKLHTQFESLSVDLKNAILSRNVKIDTIQDLIVCLEQIAQGE